jgi:transposase InsO family protein
MPFGLTNAPSTFQGLMNSIFKPFLRKFVLVFFDDILIYSKSWEDHLQHVDKVLQLLKEQQLYAKPSKCFFGVKEVEYLGHIVSHEGVKVDPNKIKAMMDWPIPKTLKNLRGFLGLTGYYRKFVRNYGRIAAPLTELTKKDAFSWTPEATKSFEQLKEVMCKAPILTTPDFTKTFIVECDASGNGIGVVLMQEGRPLAFESRPLKGRDLHKPIYEKEMMAILHALKKWHPYLIGRHFKVKTDHDSLKYFLEQRLSSEEQQKWVTKILGYDFEIVYKKGKQNVVADALSRKDEDVEAFLCAISIIQPDWIIEARDEWKNDEKVWTLIERLQQDSGASDTFTWKNDSLWYKDRLYLCKNSQLKQKVLLELHTSPVGGHSGFLKTYHRVKKDFFWDGLKNDVQRFVAECLVCQQNKVETIKTPGLLQPLSIPSQRWEEVSMDFITGLPKSEGKSVIMVIVDRLTKYAHFCALSHPFKASTVATAFMETVQKLHGSPKIIVSDRDPIFTGHFWTELFSCLGTQLAHSSSYHPQSDGQTEIVNKCLEGYLRCFVSDKQAQWFKWLPLAEWWYNTSFHTATKMTPFMALYGYHPPSITSSLKEKSKVQAVEDHIENQQQVLQILKDNLTMAQNRMKQQADQHRSERSFEVGDWVFLRLQPYKQMSLKQAKKDNKLSPKYYGPYKVLQKIGTMAYKLELPASSRVHPVFHVSCLKKVIGDKIPVQTILPELDEEGKMILEPEAITDTRIRQLRNRSISEYLIKWRKLPAEDSTWEDESFIQKHPELLKRCGQHLSQGEGHVKP